MKKICIIANGYPTNREPLYAFIKPVVSAFVDAGLQCDVIVPQSITKKIFRKKDKRPLKWIDESTLRKRYTIYQPTYFSFSNFKVFGFSLSAFFKMRAIKKVIKNEKMNFDAVYAHFWDCAMVAAFAKIEAPIFVATGESHIWVRNQFPDRFIKKSLHRIEGVISVSTKNLDESEKLGLLRYSPKTIVLPNAYDVKKFYKESQENCRIRLGVSEKDFIVAFVGTFSERKGVNRLIAAVNQIPNVKLILIGSGKKPRNSPQIVYCGTLSHDDIVHYLNAADVFVLPTLAEGCCNAIVEAMACGLPIISSNLSFNDDILDDECSIRIDPRSIYEINSAIQRLVCDSKLKKEMGQHSLEKASTFIMEKRVMSIINFMRR